MVSRGGKRPVHGRSVEDTWRAWADRELDAGSLLPQGKEDRVLFHCLHREKIAGMRSHKRNLKEQELQGCTSQPASAQRTLCLLVNADSCILFCTKRNTSSLWQLDKQPRGLAEDAQISKIIFFLAGQRKLEKETSQVCFFSPDEEKKTCSGGILQMFPGWEDKPLKSPWTKSLLFS